MTVKMSEIHTVATGNRIPCHGDEFETAVDGVLYRAEFYYENGGLNLAADSKIEKFNEALNEWEAVEFEETSEGDEEFNALLDKITPDVEEN